MAFMKKYIHVAKSIKVSIHSFVNQITYQKIGRKFRSIQGVIIILTLEQPLSCYKWLQLRVQNNSRTNNFWSLRLTMMCLRNLLLIASAISIPIFIVIYNKSELLFSGFDFAKVILMIVCFLCLGRLVHTNCCITLHLLPRNMIKIPLHLI